MNQLVAWESTPQILAANRKFLSFFSSEVRGEGKGVRLGWGGAWQETWIILDFIYMLRETKTFIAKQTKVNVDSNTHCSGTLHYKTWSINKFIQFAPNLGNKKTKYWNLSNIKEADANVHIRKNNKYQPCTTSNSLLRKELS